jgi:hypothetical protein
LKITLDHFFPQLNDWIEQFDDPRDADRCTYPTSHMIHLGMTLFFPQLGARRQLRSASRTPQFLDNLNGLADTENETVAHPDAMNYLLERLPPDNLGDLAYRMTYALVRGKVLDKYRLDGDILIAVDGVIALSQSHKTDTNVPCPSGTASLRWN